MFVLSVYRWLKTGSCWFLNQKCVTTLGKSVNKVCIWILNYHPENKFKTELFHWKRNWDIIESKNIILKRCQCPTKSAFLKTHHALRMFTQIQFSVVFVENISQEPWSHCNSFRTYFWGNDTKITSTWNHTVYIAKKFNWQTTHCVMAECFWLVKNLHFEVRK